MRKTSQRRQISSLSDEELKAEIESLHWSLTTESYGEDYEARIDDRREYERLTQEQRLRLSGEK